MNLLIDLITSTFKKKKKILDFNYKLKQIKNFLKVHFFVKEAKGVVNKTTSLKIC